MKDKPRVCFLYECRFRNDGPPLFLKTNFARYVEELGILEVRHFVQGDEYRAGKFDLYIWVDHGEDVLPIPKYACPHPSVYWCSDSHLGAEYRLEKAKEFDIVFLSIKKDLKKFKEHLGHDRVFWLPHAGEPTCYSPYDVISKYDVSFIGHLPTEERIDALDRLFKEFPNFYYGQKFFEEAARVYSMSKLAFNCSVSDEANMRSFEVPLTKTVLLTDYSSELEDLGFEDKKNCLMYSDFDEMIAKAKLVVSDEKERLKIANSGYNLVKSNHTYLHRARKIMEVVKGVL